MGCDLERERGSQGSNHDRVTASGLHRVEQHQHTGRNRNVVTHPQAVKRLHMQSAIRLTPRNPTRSRNRAGNIQRGYSILA